MERNSRGNICCCLADTNELIINSELEFDDRTEYRQSALQFEDHKARKG